MKRVLPVSQYLVLCHHMRLEGYNPYDTGSSLSRLHDWCYT